MKKTTPKRAEKAGNSPHGGISKEYVRAWSNDNAIEFYSAGRNSMKDVYESEKYFLREVMFPGIRVCDVGCGTGGFLNVLKQYAADVKYTGIDVSEEMIKNARRIHPGISFYVSDGNSLDFEDSSFDLVMLYGVLHMNLDWKDMIKECWRITKRYLLFDLRLTEGKSVEDINRSYQKIAFNGNWDGKSIVPYVVVNASEAVNAMKTLADQPSVRAYGYIHRSSDMAVTPYKEVCMTSFCLDKTKRSDVIDWKVPIELRGP
jgi:ubiquinone/menaquinone biosynthesis C-methylase UbiE